MYIQFVTSILNLTMCCEYLSVSINRFVLYFINHFKIKLFKFYTLISIPISKVKYPYKDQIKYKCVTEIMKLSHISFTRQICGNILYL